MRGNLRSWPVYILTVLIVSACNFTDVDVPTPTVEILMTDTPTTEPTPTATASLTPTGAATTDTDSINIRINTPQPRPTMETEVLPDSPPTETPGPWTYTIRENDTLGVIVARQPWGYPPFDVGAMAAIVNLNDNVPNIDTLPPIGSDILIPQRTPTPIPEGIELTQTVDAQIGVSRFGSVVLAEGATTGCHTVLPGQTIIDIADQYNTTLEVLSQLNQNLNWTGCQFSEFSGGPSCNVLIFEDQCIFVPLPTPTPAPTSTLTGNETATPTPTYVAPRLVFPSTGAIAPAGVFELQWATVGVLRTNELYLVEFQDLTNGQSWNQITEDTSLRIDENRIPNDGQTHQIQWRVTVVQRTDGGYEIVGGVSNWKTFNWQSR